MSRMYPSRCLLFFLAAFALRPAGAADLTVNLRSRVEAFKGSGDWRAVSLEQSLPVEKTAVLICDMWDKHWCSGCHRSGRRPGGEDGAVSGVGSQARDTDHSRTVGDHAFLSGHAAAQTHSGASEGRTALRALSLFDPPLPIDDKRGGCDTPDQFYKAWTREHPGLRIDASDVISDNGTEIYSFLRARDIRTLLVMGVHTNMCVLNRTFAIKRMTALGIRCILVRDLTDAMYNPEDAPHVSHDAGTQLVIEYIEKYWCSDCDQRRSAARIRALERSQVAATTSEYNGSRRFER